MPALTLARALWLCAALLCAQWLGHAHAVAHGGAAPALHLNEHLHGHLHEHLHEHLHDAAGHSDTHSHAHDELLVDEDGAEHAEGHAAGDAECRLIDQLGHGDLLWAPSLPHGLAAASGTEPQAATLAPRARAPAAAYQARAPPRLG